MTPLPWHIDAVGGVHPIAYWLMHTLRGLAPKTSFWRDAQFDTLRLGLIKVAVRVTELVTKINLAADRLCLSARLRNPRRAPRQTAAVTADAMRPAQTPSPQPTSPEKLRPRATRQHTLCASVGRPATQHRGRR